MKTQHSWKNKQTKLWYIYTMEYYSAIKNNETTTCAATWMQLEICTKWSKSERERQIPYDIIYMCSLKCGINGACWVEGLKQPLHIRRSGLKFWEKGLCMRLPLRKWKQIKHKGKMLPEFWTRELPPLGQKSYEVSRHPVNAVELRW